MNVLILANHLNTGGITRYVLDISYGLKKRGHKLFVASLPGEGKKFLKENGISFFSLPLKTKSILSWRIFVSYFILKRFIRKENIDLIHAQTRITQFLAFVLNKRSNIPYVSTFHGFYRVHLMRKLLPCLGNLTIAISQAVGQHLIKDFNLNRDNLRVIYTSVRPHFNRLTNKDFTYLKSHPTLGIVARLSQEKGHAVLFAAFRQLIRDYPQARLLVIGSGKKEGQLKHWAKKQNLSKQIVFLGDVIDLQSLFRVIDISVLPSSIEGLGLSILEAQANSVPVVASSVGGIKEIIEHKETGILVEPDNPDELCRGIKLLLEDSLLRQRIIDNAKEQIKQRFSLERMIEQVESVYRELINKNR